MAEPEVEQRLFTQLFEMVGIKRDPAWIGPFTTTNRMIRTLSHIAAQDGRHSHALKCDSDGRLLVAGSAGQSPILIDVPITGLSAFESILGTPGVDGGLWYGFVSAAYLLTQMLAILSDVHDPVTHTLKTTVVP